MQNNPDLEQVQRLIMEFEQAVQSSGISEPGLNHLFTRPWESSSPKVVAAWNSLTHPDNLQGLTSWANQENATSMGKEFALAALGCCHLRSEAIQPWNPTFISAKQFKFFKREAQDAKETGVYRVPTRFGTAALMSFMTVFALLFGLLEYCDAHPVVYLFFGTQGVIICLGQMYFGGTPRAISAATGAVLLPLWIMVAMPFMRSPGGNSFALIVFTAIFSIPLGALFGYLSGALAASVFLIADLIEPHLQNRQSAKKENNSDRSPWNQGPPKESENSAGQ